MALLASAVLAACGGGGSEGRELDASATAPAAPLVASAAVHPGTLLSSDWSTYPRLVRLAYQADATHNGRILASVTERLGGHWQPGFHVSEDDGRSFRRLGSLVGAEFDQGVCCGTLYELPQAVGVLPAGTLLYAVSVGHDTAGAWMDNRLYRSDDGGGSFQRIDGATCGRSALPRVPGAPGTGVWEPELYVAADGALACIYSDESVPGQSQVLQLTQTSDGVRWSAPRVIAAGRDGTDRPGMAGVRRLAPSRYAMVYEHCSTARLDCAVRIKLSADGLDWGAPDDWGLRPQTAAGQYFRHTPTLALVPGTATGGQRLALIGQIVSSDQAAVDQVDNGHSLLVNDHADASGPWRRLPAPIGVADAPLQTNWCQNYSSPRLPSLDGSRLLMVATDLSADGGCNARFGSAALAP